MKTTHKIQRKHDALGWRDVPFASGNRSYCDGYLNCADSMYPSKPVRIVRLSDDKVVRETKGRAAPHVN